MTQQEMSQQKAAARKGAVRLTSYLVCRRTLDIVHSVCTDQGKMEVLNHPDFVYPDGSLQFDFDVPVNETALGRFFQKGPPRPHIDYGRFRAIPPFGSRGFGVVYPGKEYERRTRDSGLGISPPENRTPAPDAEWDLTAIPVEIGFYYRPRKNYEEILPEALARWEATGALRGEGSPRLNSGSLNVEPEPTKEIYDIVWATFTIDLSESGQTAINWLVLSLIALGLEHTPAVTIRVGPKDQWHRDLIARVPGAR